MECGDVPVLFLSLHPTGSVPCCPSSGCSEGSLGRTLHSEGTIRLPGLSRGPGIFAHDLMLCMGVCLPLEPCSLTAIRDFWPDEGRSLSLGSGPDFAQYGHRDRLAHAA
ncbi:hypothetical protein BD310DRAFT_694913 [Dichomitus squalens]|uniref:Uncharacterized protein n=1 Tax=Dichomitus squalens TaxID=114155 RepID=A0A4Q9PM16_9APHY|nr:hypothetical protein BD310DRAFT_694913 [Dichomitus squalens]